MDDYDYDEPFGYEPFDDDAETFEQREVAADLDYDYSRPPEDDDTEAQESYI
jgi:hypothetical protein